MVPPVVLPRSNIATRSAQLRTSGKRREDRSKSVDDALNENNQNNYDYYANGYNELDKTANENHTYMSSTQSKSTGMSQE